MQLKPETAGLLSGFEKRMKFLNIARYLAEYPRKESIREMIDDEDVMVNLIVAVLVFIKERTLGNEQSCRLEDIADFLDDLSPVLPAGCSGRSAELARFVVVDVLQKGGVLKNYKVFASDREAFGPAPVRLIEEEKGAYHLTDDAFDFLFRSMEIEAELARVRPALATLTDEQAVLDRSVQALADKLAALQLRIDAANGEIARAETRLDERMAANDHAAADLGIRAMRKLNGQYRRAELDAWRSAERKKERTLDGEIAAAQKALAAMEQRAEAIPLEMADAHSAVTAVQTEKKAAEEQLAGYRSLEDRIRSIFQKHGLDAAARFTSTAADYLSEQIAKTGAAVQEELRRIESAEEALAAAQRGTLHIPKLLTDYLDSTGLHYTSIEKYILTQQEQGNLSAEA